jgi:hypothetical protein
MTTPTASRDGTDHDWHHELETYLGPACFPGGHDHLAATLIRRHAPSHLLWRLSVLPRMRQFDSLDELIAHLDTAGAPVGDDGVAGRPL